MGKITTIVCALSLLVIPVTGVATNNPNSHEYTRCRGIAYGEIVDYKLSLIAQLIIFLRGEPFTLLITRATIVIRQNPECRALELMDPVKHCCMAFNGNITIHFYASIAKINFYPAENCTVPICSGIFGHIYVEEN
jgi:hypothetical protein